MSLGGVFNESKNLFKFRILFIAAAPYFTVPVVLVSVRKKEFWRLWKPAKSMGSTVSFASGGTVPSAVLATFLYTVFPA